MKSIDQIIEENKGKRILICANGPTSMHDVGEFRDYSNEGCNVWTVNGGWIHHPYSNLGFMMDDWASIAHDTDWNQRDAKERRNKACPIPILTPTEYPEFPAFVKYPIEKVVDRFQFHYFGETTTYMLAFALLCDASEIYFTGSDYMGCKASERASTEAWIGFGTALGYKIYTNPKSHFMSTHIDDRNCHVANFYGYLKETFPFEVSNNGDLQTINFEKTRYSEIDEFKKTYKEYIKGNQDGQEKESSVA